MKLRDSVALPDWTGRAVAILAGGPSLNSEICEQVREKRWTCGVAGPAWEQLNVIVINDAVRLAPWADMLYAADIPWWERNEGAANFAGLKVSVDPGGKADNPERRKCPDGTIFLQKTGRGGFDPRRGTVRAGEPKQHSGYQALHLAIQLGAARVLLLGYDCRGMTGKNGSQEFDFEVTVPGYRDLMVAADARACDVVNCTPGSALVWFRRAELREVLG